MATCKQCGATVTYCDVMQCDVCGSRRDFEASSDEIRDYEEFIWEGRDDDQVLRLDATGGAE